MLLLHELSTASDLCALAAEKYNSGNYLGAIEVFRKSIALKEDFYSYNGLGWALLGTDQYLEAIDAFRKSIALKESWGSYNGLGWALALQSKYQYPEAIDAFHNSIALNEGWNSYMGLGRILALQSKYPEAIDAFHNSISLKEDWNSYNGLGWALINTHQSDEAIDNFRKSIVIKEDWNSYFGLGKALSIQNKYPEAIDAFHNSISLKEDWNSYNGLGWALFNMRQNQQAIDAFKKAVLIGDADNHNDNGLTYDALASIYSLKGDNELAARSKYLYFQNSICKPASLLDPYIGHHTSSVDLEKHEIIKIQSTCKEYGRDFLPSFRVEESDYLLDAWKYLVYLHIPKCGGSSFENPLHQVVLKLKEDQPKSLVRVEKKLFLNTGNLSGVHTLEAFKEVIADLSGASQKVESIFYAPHNIAWNKLNMNLEKCAQVHLRVLTTVRDPKSRLLSHLKDVAFECRTKEDLLKRVGENSSALDNCMHKYIFDYGLEGSTSSRPPCDTSDYRMIDHIDFIDISDASTIAKVKSSFLSASSLPNVVQYSRLNTSIEGALSLSEKDMESVYQDCLSKGYTDKDEQIDFTSLKKRTLERLNFSALLSDSTCLHPLTLINDEFGRYYILPTEDFISAPSNYFST